MALLLKAKVMAVRALVRPLVGLNSSSSNFSTSTMPTSLNASTGAFFFSTETGKTATSMELPPAPKRSANVFALFVRDHFKVLPQDMPVKEKFVKAGEQWRSLSDEEKDHYKKMYADCFVQYRKEMANYLDALSPEARDNYKKLIRDQTKTKTRQRIKTKLRQLKYPKKPISAYIYFMRHCMGLMYPEGKFPPVRSPEHIQAVSINAAKWRAISPEDRLLFDQKAEEDRERYHRDLEQWKAELAKPENGEQLAELERLSRKVEHLTKISNPATVKQAEVKRQRTRQRAIARALARKSKAAASAEKSKLKAKKKSAKLPGVKKSAAGAKAKKMKDEIHEDFD